MRLTSLTLAAVLLALPVAGQAHRQWLLPSGTIFSGNDPWVTVDAAVSNDLFYFDHVPMRLDAVKAWAPDGSEVAIANPATGKYRSTFDVQLNKPGTWKIGSAAGGVMGSYKLNGEEKRIGGRGAPPRAPGAPLDIPAGATDVNLTETMNRNEIFVTSGEPTNTVFAPTGRGLELQPVTHPNDLVAGEAATFRFLIDGKPAPNLKVTVVPGGKRYRDDLGEMALTTDAKGEVAVTWPNPGMYWVNATASDDRTSSPQIKQRRLAYVTTLEVLNP